VHYSGGNKVQVLLAAGSGIADPLKYGALISADGDYFTMSGSSVSATAALMLDGNPTLKPGHVKLALQLSAVFMKKDGILACGSGSLNAAGAVQMAVEGPSPLIPPV